MEGEEEVNIEELAANLSTYKDQLQQVIALTEELLETAQQNGDGSEIVAGTSGDASPNLQLSGGAFDIRRTTAGDGNKYPLGIKVQAIWSKDKEWYDATIEGHSSNGYYVRYDGWGNREEVDPANVRPIQEGTADPLLEAEKVAVATKEALKRKISLAAASKDSQSWTVPSKLQIDPNDSEDVKATKRKKIHAFKSKKRMEAKEVTQNKRQNAWQEFQTTKGKAKKVGFFSGRKRESIFKSPEDPFGKVGVTGSGKGLTEFQKREKHLHLKGANMESAADE